MTDFGYAGEIIKVDIGTGQQTRLSTGDYTERFLGGRGIGARLYWEMSPVQVKTLDPENPLAFVTGPVTGFTWLAGPRWQVCAKSPSMHPEIFSYNNLGERWGAGLKFAGFDGLVVQGRVDRPSYLYI